ncbi:hypothetical protein [Tichowtungia aerotolerans]|uniref:Autotransporter outer membrane beta-barrel domain-containing protein n=1 Tax=Tichowtungia aerotolerans TaxID=2697043 RepID=A0A6P1M9Q5_9BACT|nr:hypothetical protein [Tichowtungia aerotolerans]QHI70772.1 hypothetical protein GT409_15430 [Tichowtungia aerotolerans]
MKKWVIHIFSVLLLGAVTVQAGNNVYKGTAGDNDFNNDSNWWNSLDPTDSAFLRGDNLDANPSWAFPNLSATATVSRVVFQASVSTKSYTISGEKLTIDGNGDAQTLLIDSQAANTNVQTFANSVELVSINSANNYHIKTTGAGALVFNGTLSQGSSSAGLGIGLYAGDIEINGSVNSSGKLLKLHDEAGDGIVKFTGSGAWTGGGVVQISSGAKLLLDRDTTDSSGFVPSSVQLGGGILTLGNDEQIGNSAQVYFSVTNGGLFELDGHTESIGQLLFDRDTIYGVLNMGDGGVLRVKNQSSTATWGSLIVTNWVDGSNHIYVDGGSFSETQLAAITFDGYAAGAQVAGGELYPASLSVVSVENNVYTGLAGDNDLNNDSNWWNSLGSNDAAFFRGDNIASNPAWATPFFSSSTTLTAVKFTDESGGGAAYTFSGSDLTIDGSVVTDGQTVLIDMLNSSHTQTFSNNVELVSFNNALNSHVKTSGEGSLVFAGGLSQGDASQGIGIRLYAGDLEISGDVDGSSKLWKLSDDSGDGIMKLTGSGAWTGGGTVQVASGAELLLARDTTDSTGFAPGSVQMGGGILTLGNDEQITDSARVYYTVEDGGVFDLNGFEESVDELLFDRDTIYGVLEMGDGGVLRLVGQSSTATWGSLVVTGWESGLDHIYVDGGSFSTAQLAAITFDGYSAGAKVESGELLPAGNILGFSGWIDNYSLTGGDEAADADPDGDGVVNLYEYGFGGDPTNDAVTGTLPTFEISGSTVEIVHVERTGAISGISYSVQQTPELVSPAWTTAGVSLIGESADVDGFKTVTNQVSADAAVKFLKVFVAED